MRTMQTEREKLTAQRDELLKEFNRQGQWDQERYDKVVDVDKRLAGLPEPKPPKKAGR